MFACLQLASYFVCYFIQMQVWNAELATVAQNYAAQCVFEHNSQRVSQQSTFTSVGENLYASSGLAVNYTSAVQSWFNERSDYTYETNTCAENSVCGHYTQVYVCVGVITLATIILYSNYQRSCTTVMSSNNNFILVIYYIYYKNESNKNEIQYLLIASYT